jgi:hypothetical protein
MFPTLRATSAPVRTRGPFDLEAESIYQCWLAQKLEHYPQTAAELIVEVRDPLSLTKAERAAIIERCRKTNMVIYACRGGDITAKLTVRGLGRQLGLRHLDNNLCADNDNISSVRAMSSGQHQEYIPYTNRPLNWHTDGYYNRSDQKIRAFIIHCVRDAANGGENAFFDPEIAYALLRNENPEYVTALMQPDAMTIPANVERGVEIRGAETGPVFSLDAKTKKLHMRYTARKRNIQWKQDAMTGAAVRFLEDVLTRESRYIFRHRLAPGQGIICNNVLHSRRGFQDDASSARARLLYRTRYYERIAGT